MNALNPMTTLINAMTRLSADLNSVGYGLESDLKYTIKSARADIQFFINEARKECEANGLAIHFQSVLEVVSKVKGNSRTALALACNVAIEGLALLESQAQQEAAQEPQDTEKAFITRCVHALDKADYGTHNVYVHFFRIEYGVWMDAVEVVNAGSLADYLESLGLSAADTNELMVQDWDYQDAENLALKCLGCYGSFDWERMEELLEVMEECEPEVLSAGLSIGIPADQVADLFLIHNDEPTKAAQEIWEMEGKLDELPEWAIGFIDWEHAASELRHSYHECNGYYFQAC